MTKSLAASIVSLLALGVSTLAAAGPADDVRCRETAFSQSAEQRDAEKFSSFIDADARFVGNSVQRGVEQIVAAWQVFFADDGPAIRWRPQFVEVLEEGRLALTRGPFRLTSVDDDGNSVETWGTFNSVWRLHDDGEWKVVFDAGSPPNQTPTDEQLALLASDNCNNSGKAGD